MSHVMELQIDYIFFISLHTNSDIYFVCESLEYEIINLLYIYFVF